MSQLTLSVTSKIQSQILEKKMEKKHSEHCYNLKALFQGCLPVERPTAPYFANIVSNNAGDGQVGELRQQTGHQQIRGRSPSVNRARTNYTQSGNYQGNKSQGKPKPVVGTIKSDLTEIPSSRHLYLGSTS